MEVLRRRVGIGANRSGDGARTEGTLETGIATTSDDARGEPGRGALPELRNLKGRGIAPKFLAVGIAEDEEPRAGANTQMRSWHFVAALASTAFDEQAESASARGRDPERHGARQDDLARLRGDDSSRKSGRRARIETRERPLDRRRRRFAAREDAHDFAAETESRGCCEDCRHHRGDTEHEARPKPASIGADTQTTGIVTELPSSNCTSTLAASLSVVEPSTKTGPLSITP